MVNKYILIRCGIKMSFVRLLTFGIHVLADTHRYSRIVIILLTYFLKLTLLYKVSAEANCFLRFIVIKCAEIKHDFVQRAEDGITSARPWTQ